MPGVGVAPFCTNVVFAGMPAAFAGGVAGLVTGCGCRFAGAILMGALLLAAVLVFNALFALVVEFAGPPPHPTLDRAIAKTSVISVSGYFNIIKASGT